MIALEISRARFTRWVASMRVASLIVILGLVVSACDGLGQPARDDSAANLMPSPAGYTVVNTLDIQDTLAKLSGGAALAAASPQVTALIAAANAVAKCYQQAGAVEGRVMYKNAEPIKAGAIVIINRNKALDPATLVQCAGSVGPNVAGVAALKPCAKAFTLQKDNNEFYVAFVGSDTEVCTAMCSSIQGCPLE
jgi:hypothetical protein